MCSIRPLLFILAAATIGCSSDSTTDTDPTTTGGSTDQAGTTEAGTDAGDTGSATTGGAGEGGTTGENPPEVFDPADWYTVTVGPFEVKPGEERFLCFTHNVTEEVVANQIRLDSKPVIHHMVFSRTMSPDPEGEFECEVLFQNNWLPLFVAGTGDSILQMPENAAYTIEKGTQVTAQLHLLNSTADTVNDTIEIRIRLSKVENPEPVQVVVFGSTQVALPPQQVTDVVSECQSDSDMDIFAAFPHMHLQGRAMVVETGSTPDAMKEVFRRDPYDFDDQTLAVLDLTINQNDHVKVTCTYDNQLDQIVTFGESTTNEMCFFIGFATRAPHAFAGCLTVGGGASTFIPETCGDDPPNNLGLGAPCTKGGSECENGFLCTEDFDQLAGPEVCIGIGCKASADCGEGGICCGVSAADITLCLPPACMLPLCVAVD